MKTISPVLVPFAALLLAPPPAACAGLNRDADQQQLPSSTPASAVLGTVTGLPPSVTGARYTSLASALYSVERGFYNDDRYATVASHVWSAAARASDSERVVPSLALSTWEWQALTSAAWYDGNMPRDDKKRVAEFISAWSAQYGKFVGGQDAKPGDDKKGAAATAAAAPGGSAAQNLAVVWAAAALAGLAGFVAVI
ncbi:hypothetical protein V2A60_005108 [Cordyceps javanica]|uniref:Uncharacterized protein n=1 Tax=Cordyceps javanica TaxID=43265 RepID=A0A545VD51_9HYPO|nr:hypothetical protein IF1G_01867 [Cordyceps javanica]TQW10668.1 hypothetical protein IF2G_01610 [Cordyceps javanica]